MGSTRRLLITAGPTHEAIDAVRYLGNRSSGRLGIELAKAAAAGGWAVTLLLGPTTLECTNPDVHVFRFQSTADLERLLSEHFAWCDVLVMAAAVADFRPTQNAADAANSDKKLKRSEGPLRLDLEATPDLLAACAQRRRPDQVLIGFALEPPERLMKSAKEKLERKGLDAIVANPLSTMDSRDIEATLIRRDGSVEKTGAINKERFATWLLGHIEGLRC